MSEVVKIKYVDFVEHCTFCLVKLNAGKPKKLSDIPSPSIYQLWGLILESDGNVVYNFGRKEGEKRVYSELPSLCSNCEENFFKLAQLQEDCFEINRKLNYQKELIQAIAFNCGHNGANADRNNKFEKWLAGAKVRSEVVDNTKKFNQQLRGNRNRVTNQVRDICADPNAENKAKGKRGRNSVISSLKPATIILSRCKLPDDTNNSVVFDRTEITPEIKSEKVTSEEEEDNFDHDLNPDWGPSDEALHTKTVRKRGPKFLSTSASSGRHRQRCQACDVCNESIPVSQISIHLETHLQKNHVYTCPNPVCFQSYISPFRLERLHLRSSPKCKRFDSNKSKLETCDSCQIKISYPKLKFHLEMTHETPEKTWSCPFSNCDAKYSVKQSLQLHLHSHVYKCQEDAPPKTEAAIISDESSIKIENVISISNDNYSPPVSAEEDLDSDSSYHPSPSPPKKKKKTRNSLTKTTSQSASRERFQTCDVCNDTIPASQMCSHLHTHVGDYVYKCPNPECYQAHISPFTLDRKHLRRTKCEAFRTNKSNLETCAICGIQLSLQNLKLHAIEHETQEKFFSCPVSTCGENFTVKQSLELHLLKHLYYQPEETSTTKSYSGQARPPGEVKRSSIPRKSGPKSVISGCKRSAAQACDICNELIPMSKLTPHLLTHVDTVYKCPNPSCLKAYVTSFLLERLHLQKSKICKSFCTRQSQLETCEVCHIKTRFHNLKFHLNKHETSVKNFTCPFSTCKYTSTVKQSLEIHMHEHCYKVPATTQKCKLCRSLVPLQEMASHLKSHNITTLFHCDQCPFVYASRTSKIWHVFNHHVEQGDGVECDICGVSGGKFYTRKDTKDHYDKFHDKKRKSVSKNKPADRKPIKGRKLGPRYSTKFSSRPERGQACDICDAIIPLKQISDHLRSHVGDYVYECPNPNCFYAFISPLRLDRYHLRNKSPKCMKFAPPQKCKSKFHEECQVCHKQLTLQLLRRHLEDFHESQTKYYSCPISECEEKFTVKQSLEIHLLTHVHTPPMIGQKCDICEEEIGLSEITTHLTESHQIDEPFPCEQCSFVFSTKDAHLNHVILSHCSNGDEMVCDICGESGPKFYTKMTFRQHYFDAHGIGITYKCEICSHELLSLAALKNHKWTDHGKLYTKQKCGCKDLEKCTHSITILNKYKTLHCTLCDVKYKTKDYLTAHTIRVHGAERLKCGKCPETFDHPRNYKLHMKEHDGIFNTGPNSKRHQCPHCEMAFRYPGYLKCHVLTKHNAGAETPYNICQYCGKRFVSKTHFKYHVRKWHESEKEPWKICKICNKKFTGATALRNHERTHTGEKPFACELCGRTYRLRETLKRHLKGHAEKKDEFRPRNSRDKKKSTG